MRTVLATWRDHANCKRSIYPTKTWFPESGDHTTTADAKTVCALCPVRLTCLDQHLNESHGIFGAWSQQTRAALRSASGHQAIDGMHHCPTCGTELPVGWPRLFCGDGCVSETPRPAVDMMERQATDWNRDRRPSKRRRQPDHQQLALV